jgi:hypothetical protein
MAFLKKLKSLLAPTRDAPLIDLAVRCNRCKEVIHGQINLHNDLSVQYDGDTTTYFCRKGLMGAGDNRCFQQVTVEYIFDANRNVIERRVEGGQFVDEEAQA